MIIFYEHCNNGNKQNFELRMQSVIDISVSGRVGFMQRYQLKQQLQNNEAICRPTVSNTQFTIGRENGQVQEHIVRVFPINFPEPSEKSSLVSET